MKMTSVLVSPEFYELCKNNQIKFSDAMRAGISILLAEKGVKEYDNNLNVYRRMNLYKKETEDLFLKIQELQNKIQNAS
jgi:hypothetical protein